MRGYVLRSSVTETPKQMGYTLRHGLEKHLCDERTNDLGWGIFEWGLHAGRVAGNPRLQRLEGQESEELCQASLTATS